MLTNSSATCDRREGAQLRPQSELTHWQPLERDAQRHSSAIPHDRRDAEGGLKREDGQSGKRLGRVLSIFGCRIFNNSQLVQNHLQTSEFVLDGGSEAAGVTYHQARRRRHVQRDPKNGMADCSGLGRLDRCCLRSNRGHAAVVGADVALAHDAFERVGRCAWVMGSALVFIGTLLMLCQQALSDIAGEILHNYNSRHHISRRTHAARHRHQRELSPITTTATATIFSTHAPRCNIAHADARGIDEDCIIRKEEEASSANRRKVLLLEPHYGFYTNDPLAN